MAKVSKFFSSFLFLLCVLVPTASAGIYYFWYASDVFTSESQLIIRTSEKQSSSSILGDILQNSGFVNSQGDAYAVQEYILSRDAMYALDKQFSIKEKYSSNTIDIFSRFGGVIPDHSYEAFYKYYNKIIEIEIDPTSTIITLRSYAFDAKYAHEINKYLLESGENLVNKLNERARLDMMNLAKDEVSKAEEKAKKASLDLAKYQNTVGVINPEQQSTIPLQQIAKLQEELISTKTQILQIETLSPDNPQLPVLHKRASMLQKEIDKTSANLAGSTDKSLVTKVVEFNRLSLDKEFAERQLASALSSLEQTRIEAQQQQLYVERIAEPSLPDTAQEPHRIKIVIAIVILSFVIWGILSLLVAGIKEHQD